MEQNIYNAIYKVNHAGGCGSCFYLKQYDLFVTNYHVVEGFRQVAIQDNDKNSFLARVVMVNSVLDIALLSVEGDFSALPDIRLSELKEDAIGQKINVAGYPFGMPFTVTEGTVSSPRQLINNSIIFRQMLRSIREIAEVPCSMNVVNCSPLPPVRSPMRIIWDLVSLWIH